MINTKVVLRLDYLSGLILTLLSTLVLLVTCSGQVHADGIRDNDPDQVRRVPPPGIVVPPAVRSALSVKLLRLNEAMAPLRKQVDPDLLADVEVFARAVRTVLEHNEFYSEKEFEHAKKLLDEGRRRAALLAADDPDWTKQHGLVVRGFRSRVDDTVQPYGLVLPKDLTGPLRLDVWFHGRGERTTEVGFLHQRMTQVGRFSPPNTIVLHPYGRYSNAFKFAGETDVLEAIEATRRHYNIDPNRISVRGFSMGGAACWQFAVHYADRWFAANPGAGFSETPEFLKFFQKETLQPTWYEKKLWQWYDCNGYAQNLLHCPTVAYSGELDIQKQAADIMEAALAEENIDLVHIIGAKTKHTIDEASKVEIERRMAQLAELGRDTHPRKLTFRTYTLKYNRMHWLTVDALQEHWEPTTVDAELTDNEQTLVIRTENVAALSIDFPSGMLRRGNTPLQVRIDDQELAPKNLASDRSWQASFHHTGSEWQAGELPGTELRKRHNLQGPIDDAFMDSFLFIRPQGVQELAEETPVDRWAQAELAHAVTHWRQQFRGDARIKSHDEVTDEDIASSNLVLFGTPKTNSFLQRILADLPMTWDGETLQVGESTFDAKQHVPLMIYPNPLNPNRYVVLNSGFTYREYAYLNNARQVPMLPDWAVVDVRSPVTSQYPGKIVATDFFDEQWRIKIK